MAQQSYFLGLKLGLKIDNNSIYCYNGNRRFPMTSKKKNEEVSFEELGNVGMGVKKEWSSRPLMIMLVAILVFGAVVYQNRERIDKPTTFKFLWD